MKKYVDTWRNKVKTKKAFRSFTKFSHPFRSVAGNFNAPTKTNNANKYKNEMNAIMRYLMSRRIKTPTLYKGLRGKNAEMFLKTGAFRTRAPTSSSTNIEEALTFTNNKKVLLVIPPGKYYAAFMGRRGIHSVNPLELEVVLAPGTFIKNANTNNGHHRVKYVTCNSCKARSSRAS